MTLIAPTLQSGKWVICDRFADSTRAYQGVGGGVDEALIDGLEELALNGYAPDLTFVLDMDPDLAFERVRERAAADGLPVLGDRFEKEDLDFHRRLRESFLAIAALNSERCVVLSADTDEGSLAEAIWQAVIDRYPHVAEDIP